MLLLPLAAPRPDFVQTLTTDEAQLMQEHGVYWKGLMDKGLVAVFGLVGDPKSPYGIGVLTLADEADPQALTSQDPTILSKRGFAYEIVPMPRAVTR